MLFLLACLAPYLRAQEVFIPDAGLNAAVREALQKPAGPLSETDLITLTNLPAGGRGITSLQGLAVARNLSTLVLANNLLTNLDLPAGLGNLVQLDLANNSLTNLTLPPVATNLASLFLDGNPLVTVVLPEPLAVSTLAVTVSDLRSRGVQVSTYPLQVQLALTPQQPMAAFSVSIHGPPGVYLVYGSPTLKPSQPLNFVNNPLGARLFTDTAAQLSMQKFYRVALQSPPSNMVFIPPSTFMLGSPTNEQDRNLNEGPQTAVILTHGYWIGKYEVTQGDYLAVVGSNPSDFPGDLSRPISSVNWMDATNYCALLTQRELLAGRILPGTRYRLPTEAEWECAARAGTTTRFSYGDDPAYASVTSYGWFLDLGNPDLIVHPAGQKLPNAWGLFDVHGNVWEWCLDNFGTLPGGTRIDPTGPPSSLLRDKVIRGGAYDYPNSSCRSASRLFRFPLFPDSDVGFRVVLATD